MNTESKNAILLALLIVVLFLSILVLAPSIEQKEQIVLNDVTITVPFSSTAYQGSDEQVSSYIDKQNDIYMSVYNVTALEEANNPINLNKSVKIYDTNESEDRGYYYIYADYDMSNSKYIVIEASDRNDIEEIVKSIDKTTIPNYQYSDY